MAKLLFTSKKGKIINDHEDIFKLSNSIEDWLEINPSTEASLLLKNTFYTIVDEENKTVRDIINNLYPTSVFKNIDESWKIGFCSHITNNVLHCSNSFIRHFQDVFQTYLPLGWKIDFPDSEDYAIGDYVVFKLFDWLNTYSVKTFLKYRVSNPDQLPPCSATNDLKNEKLTEILEFICDQPTIDDFSESFTYQIDRRMTGNILRDTSFSIFSNNNISLIGPELESVKNVVKHLYNGGKFEFFTIDTTKDRTYSQNLKWQEQTKLTFSHAISSQRKNQNNFFKGLIKHSNLYGFPQNILYIGSYPSFWLEDIKWFPALIHCYDPKHRQIDLPYVRWYTKEFTFDDLLFYQNDIYAYIDIRSDIRGQSISLFKKEDDFIVNLALQIVQKKNSSAFVKRKVFDINITYDTPIYPVESIHFGQEYYNHIFNDTINYTISKDTLFKGINSAITNNPANYVFSGIKFLGRARYPIIALYSISNSLNSTEIISKVLNHDKFIATFPTQKFTDWKDVPLTSNPFTGIIKQNRFTDHTIDAKAVSEKFGIEVVSEEVFVSILNGRICMPTFYNHLVCFKFPWKDFFSDRYFQHIGIRQPSIYRRDRFRTSRLTAYINRKLTHSTDLSGIGRNNFEGYSGHLIAIETTFNSLVYTMSPFRWIIRSLSQLNKPESNSRSTIGRNQPHTYEEYENTYEYLAAMNVDPLHKKLHTHKA